MIATVAITWAIGYVISAFLSAGLVKQPKSISMYFLGLLFVWPMVLGKFTLDGTIWFIKNIHRAIGITLGTVAKGYDF